MRNLKYIPILILLCAVGIQEINGQSRMQKKGNEAFRSHQYQSAIENYERALEKSSQGVSRDRLIHRLAEIHHILHSYSNAGSYYQQIADSRYAQRTNEVWVEYAEVLLKMGKVDEAEIHFQKFLDANPDSEKAKNGLASIEMIRAFEGRNGLYEIQLQEGINSNEDDFGVSYFSRNYRQILFTSNRNDASGKLQDDWTGNKFSDLFESTSNARGGWNTPRLADRNGVVNTEDHEGTPYLAFQSNTLYFTRCPRVVDSRDYCQILSSTRRGSSWSPPKVVLSDRTSNMGHPTLTGDELTIFFSSSKRDNYGERDIYMAKRESTEDDFGEPINLGPVINTSGDEKFPRLKNDSILYFSSNGHPGFGGLDIFYSVRKNETDFSEPQNIFPPINSHSDDFGMIFHPELEQGFFSSNREGGMGGDDVYGFSERTLLFAIQGDVSDANSGLNIPDFNVFFINSNADSLKIDGSPNGYYELKDMAVDHPQEYDLVAVAPNYFSQKKTISTIGLTTDANFINDFQLEPIPADAIVLPEIMYDYGKWDILPQYHDSLAVLLDILTTNPNLVIEIRSHTDSRNTFEFNDDLSQKRAQSVIDYLIGKGIESDRLQARGYGKRAPRILDKDFRFGQFLLPEGTRLDDDYISSLRTNDRKEIAHQLNRRTEFSVISRNYVPSQTPSYSRGIKVVTDLNSETIPFELSADSTFVFEVSFNEFSTKGSAVFNEPNSFIDSELVLALLSNGYITRENFLDSEENFLEENKVKENVKVSVDRLRIGGVLLRDMVFIVKDAMTVDAILGENVLGELTSFDIDEGNNQIIIKY